MFCNIHLFSKHFWAPFGPNSSPPGPGFGAISARVAKDLAQKKSPPAGAATLLAGNRSTFTTIGSGKILGSTLHPLQTSWPYVNV